MNRSVSSSGHNTAKRDPWVTFCRRWRPQILWNPDISDGLVRTSQEEVQLLMSFPPSWSLPVAESCHTHVAQSFLPHNNSKQTRVSSFSTFISFRGRNFSFKIWGKRKYHWKQKKWQRNIMYSTCRWCNRNSWSHFFFIQTLNMVHDFCKNIG